MYMFFILSREFSFDWFVEFWITYQIILAQWFILFKSIKRLSWKIYSIYVNKIGGMISKSNSTFHNMYFLVIQVDLSSRSISHLFIFINKKPHRFNRVGSSDGMRSIQCFPFTLTSKLVAHLCSVLNVEAAAPFMYQFIDLSLITTIVSVYVHGRW